jgi:hypothetical protein
MQKEMMDKEPMGKPQGKDMPMQPGKAGQKGLSPEQQKAFNMVSKQALEFLLEDNNAKLIVAKAQQSDPQTAIVEAIRPVMQGIWQAAEQSGVKLDLPVFLAAALNVITILADMMAVQGVIPEEQVAQLAQSAAQEAVKQHNAEMPQEQPQEPAGLAATAGGM